MQYLIICVTRNQMKKWNRRNNKKPTDKETEQKQTNFCLRIKYANFELMNKNKNVFLNTSLLICHFKNLLFINKISRFHFLTEKTNFLLRFLFENNNLFWSIERKKLAMAFNWSLVK